MSLAHGLPSTHRAEGTPASLYLMTVDGSLSLSSPAYSGGTGLLGKEKRMDGCFTSHPGPRI